MTGWAILSLGILAAVFWAAGRPRERLYDFRGKPLPGEMRPFGSQAGRYVVAGPDGLLVTIPRGKERVRRGVTVPADGLGDCEITLAFEILKADKPSGGFGGGTLLTIDQLARIGWLRRPDGKDVIVWDRWESGKEHRRLEAGQEPCLSESGRLRLRRDGTRLSFLWSPETNGREFRLVHECDFGTDRIKVIKMIVETEPGAALDARFPRLVVTGNSADSKVAWWLAVTGSVALAVGAAGWRWLGPRTATPTAPGSPDIRREGAAGD